MTARLEYCCECGNPTGRAGRGEDSIYDDADDSGPYCEDCWRERQEAKEPKAMTTTDDELLARYRMAATHDPLTCPCCDAAGKAAA